MNELLAFRVKMPFAARRTWRRWMPIWIGPISHQGHTIGAYVRLGSTAYMVSRKPPTA